MTEMDPPKDVQAAIERLPAAPRARMLELRALILAAAAEAKVTPLTETLKWGQPSFAPVPRSAGTPIRIGWSEKTPETIGLFVHCQSGVMNLVRDIYTDALTYDKNRGILLPLNTAPPETVVYQFVTLALTYKRKRRVLRV